MGRRYGFDGVTDQLAARKGKTHATMTHGDAVTDADRRKFDRRTAGSGYPKFNGLGNFA